MSKDGKYIAYVGTYTLTNSEGIYIYDVDPETGELKKKSVAKVSNPSAMTVSADKRFLYSIEDEGVCSFRIKEDGDLERINSALTQGMRGDTLTVDSKNSYLFVGGYHDGKITVMKLNEDGSIGKIAFSIYHTSLRSGFGERHNDHAKVTKLVLTPDEKFLCAVDLGINQVKIYSIDYDTGRLSLYDLIRPALESGARVMKFSADGKFAYILTSFSNHMEVYKYDYNNGKPVFEEIQDSEVLKKDYSGASACNFVFSEDGKHIAVSVDAFNGVAFLDRDPETGKVVPAFQSLTSGDFPKSLALLPGDRFVSVLNHDTDEIRTFGIDYKKGYILLKAAPVKISKPNCIRIIKL